jgi:hypothetical protein
MCDRGLGLVAGKRQAATGELWSVVRAPPSRSREGHPIRSHLTRAERGNPVRSPPLWRGRPTVRKAELRDGNRMPKKRMPVVER